VTGTELVKLVEWNGALRAPEDLVSGLEALGGSLKRFLADYPEDKHEFVLACIEHLLAENTDKRLKQRWNTAINRNALARMRLLQNRSLERLESLSVMANNAFNWAIMAKESQAHKMILADLLAGTTHAAKQKPEALIESNEDADARDAADAEAAMEV
jgi:hypothetical protein